MRNISEIPKQSCCGCELCGLVCNRHAISFYCDEEGFLYPNIDNNKCVNCGLCLSFCPVNEKLIKKREHNLDVYALSLIDDNLLKKSSSGGAACSIMQYGVKNSMVVVGVAYDEDFKGCHYDLADTNESIKQFQGTKYIQAKKNGIYNRIKELLQLEKTVIFIGLPCEVAACRCFLGNSLEKIVFVELVCHGVSSPKVAAQYIERMKLKYGNISWMTIRDKKYGWTPGCLKIIFDNGKIIHHLFDSTEYGYAFRNLSRPSCYSCQYKGDKRVADITIGDFWGAAPEDECWNSNGVSVVFVHTEKGRKLIRNLEGINLTKINYSQGIKNNSLINKPRSIGNRNNYSNSFCQNDIFIARKENESVKQRVIRVLRNMKYKFKDLKN